MKLLFDENLAGRLAQELSDLYPGSADVASLGLGGAKDSEVWARAAVEGYVLVTKDEDFHRMSVMLGPPPKVIWIRLGNCSMAEIANLLRRHSEDLLRFAEEAETAFLALG